MRKKPEALSNKTVRPNSETSDTYRKLIDHLRGAETINNTYKIKQKTAYRAVICDLHNSVPLSYIKKKFNAKGYKVTNIMNVRHRVSKESLPMLMLDQHGHLTRFMIIISKVS